MMKKVFKMLGRGFIFGLRHPFTNEGVKRTDDMTTIDGIVGDIGMSISQGTIQTVWGVGVSILFLVGLGWLSDKINDSDLKVKMIIDEKDAK